MRKLFFATLLAIAGLWQAGATSAQTAWPTRPVRLILPTVPGGGTDTLARTLQNAVSAKLGQSLLIENRPGGALILATEMVARATDGHTIGMIVVNTHAANVTVQEKLPYDTLKDFTPIINLNSSPNIIAVHPSFPAKTLAELIAEAKANPGKHFYATSGVAGGQHFAGEMLKQSAGIDMVHVPYKGTGASLKDAVSGQIKIIFGNIISAGPHVASGSLRGLAITGLKRSSSFPDLPTVAELGFPGFDITDSYSIMGPANMPPDVVKKIHDAFREAMLSPEVRPRLEQPGVVPNLMGPEELGKFVEAEVAKLREIALKANIKGEL
jgi:tripartite-type tricarboxylate transporter receptor subunit TctC